MMETKIQLSPAEMDLMCDAGIILTKNVVLEKTWRLLEAVQQQMQDHVNRHGVLKESAVFNIPPKISKGENYRGLPYLILDYPRVFGQPDTFAVRTFFWWGHFFSSTWQLAGDFKKAMLPKIVNAYPTLAAHYYINIGTDPWQHHFGADNYKPIAAFSKAAFERHLMEQEPIKIAASYPLTEWHSAANSLFHNWKLWMDISNS